MSYRNRRIVIVGATAIAAAALSGCATLRGGPEPVGNSQKACVESTASQSALAVLAETQCTTIDWLTGDDNALKKQRNNVVTLRMMVADRHYYAFERNLLNDTRQGNFATTLALLGFSTAASVVKQGPLSRSLSTAATAVTGAKQGFDKDVLLERTIQVLTTQMQAERAKAKEIILTRLGTSYDEWPIGLAMSDVEAYERAGTLNAALNGVAQNASEDKKISEDRSVQAIRKTAYDASPAGAVLQEYISVDDESTEKQRQAKVRTAMKVAGVPDEITVPEFVYGTDARKADVLTLLIAAEQADPQVLQLLAKGLARK